MQPIQIGDFNFDYPIFPAPMCGVMDAPFRAMLLKFGTPIIYSEMVASHATILKDRKNYVNKAMLDLRKQLKIPTNVPFVIQIAGCSPEIMAEAAKIAVDNGADIVDMNFGCPVKKIVNSFAGSALMKDEKLAEQIINAVSKSVSVPITIKMRMGWDFDHLNAPKIAKIAEDAGIKTITIHCRTRSQLYSGKADWDFANKIREVVKLPIIVNGDINFNNLEEAFEVSNADGAMIGRALYGKPWLIADCVNKLKSKKNGEKFVSAKPKDLWKDCILEHLGRIFDFYPTQNAIGFAIKNLYFYSHEKIGGSAFRGNLAKAKTKEEIFKMAEEFFNN